MLGDDTRRTQSTRFGGNSDTRVVGDFRIDVIIAPLGRRPAFQSDCLEMRKTRERRVPDMAQLVRESDADADDGLIDRRKNHVNMPPGSIQIIPNSDAGEIGRVVFTVTCNYSGNDEGCKDQTPQDRPKDQPKLSWLHDERALSFLPILAVLPIVLSLAPTNFGPFLSMETGRGHLGAAKYGFETGEQSTQIIPSLTMFDVAIPKCPTSL
ncbi:hypothetical protein VTK26DRAFT_7677 [Humicola hyalothermophila]